MNIPSDEKPILDKPEGNATSLALALLVSILTLLFVFVLQISASKQKLNILVSGNEAFTSSAFLLMGLFVIIETIAKHRQKAKRFVAFGRRTGFIGFLYILTHLLLVYFILNKNFDDAWMSKNSLSLTFAWGAVLVFSLLFVGFIGAISKKLGNGKNILIQILSITGIALVFAHILLLPQSGYYKAGQVFLGSVRQLELTFISVFIATVAVTSIFLYFLNKKISLQKKIVMHTFLFSLISALVIGSYIGVAGTERRQQKTFHSNRYLAEYIKTLQDKETDEIYSTADSLTNATGGETTIFFLNSDKRVVHHPEKKREDIPYDKIADGTKTSDDYGWETKYNDGGKLFLDSIVNLGPQGYLVVSTDYSKSDSGLGNQMVYSSFVIAIVIFVTGTMTVVFSRKNILNPIKTITDASKKIAEGSFEAKIKVSGNDEFATLAEIFNNMSQTMQKQISDLVRTDKLKNEFIAIASHNLRTPLTTLRGYLDMLGAEKSGKLSKKQKDLLEKAGRSATALTSLTEGLVNITALETQGVKIEKDAVDLNAVIAKILDEVSSQAKAKEVIVENKLGEEKIITTGDQAKLKQAFTAVLENAIKFNKKGGKIILEKIVDDSRKHNAENREVTIFIKDTGIGISKNERSNVFQKFNRGTSTYVYEYGGVGLGLYLAKLIIQAHQGKIWFESDEGKGTKFYISLTMAGNNGEKGGK